jgi:hypothetical protein
MDSSRRDNAGDYAGASERVPVAAGNGELEEPVPEGTVGSSMNRISGLAATFQHRPRPARSHKSHPF